MYISSGNVARDVPDALSSMREACQTCGPSLLQEPLHEELQKWKSTELQQVIYFSELDRFQGPTVQFGV